MSEIKLKIIDGEFWYECESLEQEKELDEILDKYDKEDKEKDLIIKELERKYKDLNNSLNAELRDPNGTIWEHAKSLQDKNDILKRALEIGDLDQYCGLGPSILIAMAKKEIESASLKRASMDLSNKLVELRK